MRRCARAPLSPALRLAQRIPSSSALLNNTCYRLAGSINSAASTVGAATAPVAPAAVIRSRAASPPHNAFSSPSPPPVRQSASSTVTVVIAVVIAIGGLYCLRPEPAGSNNRGRSDPETRAAHRYRLSDTAPTSTPTTTVPAELEQLLGMAAEIPPGRPGNLTPEQEEKLREFWKAVLKVFGVYESAVKSPTDPDAMLSPISAATDDTADLSAGGGKKRKSRLHFLRRKDKGGDNDSAESLASDATSLSITDEEDKHGQTKEAKVALASSSPEDLRKAFWSMVKHDHPDGLLLRFLRARKWDIQAALVMLVSTMHWRAEEMHVDDSIMRRGEAGMLQDMKSEDSDVKKEGEDFLEQMRMGKSFLHGVDADGRPVCVVRVRLHRQGEQTESSLERFTVYTIETARMLLRPPVDTATIIFDMTGFSMANMDYTPVKFMIKCFEANYPESLGAVLVHKSPWLFQGIWTIIRGWLDPVVAGKVHFTRNVEELESFIPRKQIPTELGGDEDWTYKYVEPVEGENAAMDDTAGRDRLLAARSELVRKYEELTVSWMTKTLDTKPAFEERHKLAEELRKNYWDLDPYVRARSLYDRTGVINKAGALTFYPKKAPEQPAPAASAAATTSEEDLD